MADKIIVTCEHASNDIPSVYYPFFVEHSELLNSHRGFDIGSLQMAERIAEKHASYSHFATVSRLLIELNRSIKHPHLFSAITAQFSDNEKKAILNQFYYPYRNAIQNTIQQYIKDNITVLHLSIHSFTPELNGAVRKADIGLLYDPKRLSENEFCKKWQKQLRNIFPQLIIRRNYPYLGTSDGLTTSLRKIFPATHYIGVELEVNQKHFINENADTQWLLAGLANSLPG